jgi:hypothetical protein
LDGISGTGLLASVQHVEASFRAPCTTAALRAKAVSFAGLRALLHFGEGMSLMGAQDSIAETHKVREHLGVEARPFRSTFRTYAEQV